LARTADDRDRAPPDQPAGIEDPRERVRDIVEDAREVGRHEAHEEVGIAVTQDLEDVGRRLADGVGGHRMP
jgi:hypothetical protein